MTPQTKADELFNKFYDQLPATGRFNAVQCAIIAVEEIIEVSNLYDQTMGYNGAEFWEEVLTELKNMQ